MDEKKCEDVKEEVHEKPHEEKGEYHMGSYYISKNSLLAAAGGALGALGVIAMSKVSTKIRPAVVGAVKEIYAFKEWTAAHFERAKEDLEDIAAEAKHAYYKDLEATAESLRKEKEILQKIEEKVQKKISRRTTKKKEE